MVVVCMLKQLLAKIYELIYKIDETSLFGHYIPKKTLSTTIVATSAKPVVLVLPY